MALNPNDVQDDWEVQESLHPESRLLYLNTSNSIPSHQPSYVPETPPETIEQYDTPTPEQPEKTMKVRLPKPKFSDTPPTKPSPALRRLHAQQNRLRREIQQEEREQAIRVARRRRDDRERALLETRQSERRLREYIADEAKKVGREARLSAKGKKKADTTV